MMLLNLLPWRLKRRQQRLRRWSLLFVLVPAIALGLVVCGKPFLAGSVLLLQAQNEYLVKTHSALQQRLNQRVALQELHKKQLHLQQILRAQQQAIRIWEARLIALAESLPPGAWLSSLTQQKGLVVVQGHSRVLESLQQLEKELGGLEGVTSVRSGAVQGDTKGGFSFEFNLTLSEVAHALAN